LSFLTVYAGNIDRL